MSLTEREKEIALEVKQKMSPYTNYLEIDEEGVKEFAGFFLSRIREEQEVDASAWITPRRYGSQVTFYRPEKPEDWDEADDMEKWYCYPLFTTPPAAPDSVPKECDCSELVEVLERWKSVEQYSEQYGHMPDAREEIATAWYDATEARDKALANHAKRMKGEA